MSKTNIDGADSTVKIKEKESDDKIQIKRPIKDGSNDDLAELEVHKTMNQKRFNEIWGIWSC